MLTGLSVSFWTILDKSQGRMSLSPWRPFSMTRCSCSKSKLLCPWMPSFYFTWPLRMEAFLWGGSWARNWRTEPVSSWRPFALWALAVYSHCPCSPRSGVLYDTIPCGCPSQGLLPAFPGKHQRDFLLRESHKMEQNDSRSSCVWHLPLSV